MEQSRRQHILFVDDDADLRTTLAETFRAHGFIVTEKANGEEAFRWLATSRPDAVLTGILMPRMGGFELIERLRTDPERRGIPIFIFSHLGRPEDRARAKKIGAKDFFVYGFIPPGEIAALIAGFLGAGAPAPIGGGSGGGTP
ncbi:MAG: hypothetical protein A3A44_01915 [Candidatus Sungbacteria bacterium RIFCSPLOWO2_01_FULL_60_25]|uniref:Response regulatory domain-containing protein n=1 Tax=Candidatus Sungbacteria bacterium RIFCSPLOWO2_01_FULL_60_25 TaxID=1802281 RepID=A0A1G2LD97_9BACT|nr:MAG: hypothetical protein A3A44_01915 [Candidatus Sungbacteria bacterium RIFCSPLOWO2_01_FULL_60_25]